jgi:hypothetical protein
MQMSLPFCQKVPWQWLNLRVDDLSDPHVLLARQSMGCLGLMYTTAEIVIAVMATVLAILAYLQRWRLAALVLVFSQMVLFLIVGLFWGADEAVRSLGRFEVYEYWLAPAVAAMLLGLVAHEISRRFVRRSAF